MVQHIQQTIPEKCRRLWLVIFGLHGVLAVSARTPRNPKITNQADTGCHTVVYCFIRQVRNNKLQRLHYQLFWPLATQSVSQGGDPRSSLWGYLIKTHPLFCFLLLLSQSFKLLQRVACRLLLFVSSCDAKNVNRNEKKEMCPVN